MKKLVLLFVFLLAGFGFNQAFAQCNAELYTNQCQSKLSTGFTFIKSYRIDGRGGSRPKIEYTCVFSKDTEYNLVMVGKDGGAKGLIATLYNENREQITSSYINNQFFDSWKFKCRVTGIYYLTFTFKDSQSYCGAAVLGFKRL